jgi:adenosylcobinamide-phosphate synthase
MEIVIAALGGVALDLLLGDPAALTPLHPVVAMGRCIRALERALRALFPQTPRGERAAGAVLAAVLPLGTLALCWGALWLLRRLWVPGAWALEILWCAQALAMKNLKDEAMGVYRALCGGTLEEARCAVGRIVGRDTGALDEAGVIRAAVETVAENFSDGVVAPLCYMLLGGAPLALAYKAVNTMDSMVGYRNERYRYFGTAAARLDDAANFLPARLAALLLAAAAGLCGQSAARALRLRRRDGRKHTSPNAGQCEAAMAGALGVQLGGPSRYFGQVVEKPAIGDALRDVEREDIPRACRMLYAGGVLAAALLMLLRGAVCLWM